MKCVGIYSTFAILPLLCVFLLSCYFYCLSSSSLENFNACSGAIMSIVCSPKESETWDAFGRFSAKSIEYYVPFVPFLWALPNGIVNKNIQCTHAHICSSMTIYSIDVVVVAIPFFVFCFLFDFIRVCRFYY